MEALLFGILYLSRGTAGLELPKSRLPKETLS